MKKGKVKLVRTTKETNILMEVGLYGDAGIKVT